MKAKDNKDYDRLLKTLPIESLVKLRHPDHSKTNLNEMRNERARRRAEESPGPHLQKILDDKKQRAPIHSSHVSSSKAEAHYLRGHPVARSGTKLTPAAAAMHSSTPAKAVVKPTAAKPPAKARPTGNKGMTATLKRKVKRK